MAGNERVKGHVKSKETGLPFSFEDCQAMFEKMSKCCGDTDTVSDCCSMMRKIKDEKSGKSEAEARQRNKK
ncbi:MAG: hypothetical protein GTN74_15770 [Proteobacteria bacterium]|nr:hypothetical protein [Pseudomonadota bacterium]NIS72073.1 hypothetical protein [Pseudomonadota bacterium]